MSNGNNSENEGGGGSSRFVAFAVMGALVVVGLGIASYIIGALEQVTGVNVPGAGQ